MAYRIKVNKKFKIDSQKVYQYLVEQWSFKVADEFTEHLYSKIYKLPENPFVGAPAAGHKNVRKIIITKHNKLYYRVKGKTITILSLFPSKQNPKRNKYE